VYIENTFHAAAPGEARGQDARRHAPAAAQRGRAREAAPRLGRLSPR